MNEFEYERKNNPTLVFHFQIASFMADLFNIIFDDFGI